MSKWTTDYWFTSLVQKLRCSLFPWHLRATYETHLPNSKQYWQGKPLKLCLLWSQGILIMYVQELPPAKIKEWSWTSSKYVLYSLEKHHQITYLECFAKSHAMGKDATWTLAGIHSLQWFKTSVPHKFHSLHLMGLQLLDQHFINFNKRFFGFLIKVKH